MLLGSIGSLGLLVTPETKLSPEEAVSVPATGTDIASVYSVYHVDMQMTIEAFTNPNIYCNLMEMRLNGTASIICPKAKDHPSF